MNTGKPVTDDYVGLDSPEEVQSSRKTLRGFLILAACVSVSLFAIGIGFLVRYHGNPGDQTLPVFSATSNLVTTNVMLGSTVVKVTVESRAGPLSSVAFLNVHENENTSVVAVRTMQYYYGGSLTRLRHGGNRTITFNLGGTLYTFDPNRMFTPGGIEASLRLYGPYSPAAQTAVAQFAAQVLDIYQYEQQPIVYCLHNNGPGYSAADYLPGGSSVNDSSAVYIAPGSSPHNFFFVTTEPLYYTITSLGFNCVLQNPVTVTDDGSLSYYSYIRNIPYANIEAFAEGGDEGDQVLIQLNMIQGLMNAMYINT